VRDVIERRYGFGDVDGVEQRQQEHRRLQSHLCGLRRQPRQYRNRLRPDRRMRDPVMADGDPRETHPRRRADDVDSLIDDRGRRPIGWAPERGEMKPDLHGV
jgi:hypothetical protein